MSEIYTVHNQQLLARSHPEWHFMELGSSGCRSAKGPTLISWERVPLLALAWLIFRPRGFQWMSLRCEASHWQSMCCFNETDVHIQSRNFLKGSATALLFRFHLERICQRRGQPWKIRPFKIAFPLNQENNMYFSFSFRHRIFQRGPHNL